MSLASLPMYDLPELREATDRLWAGIAQHLRAAGVRDVPDVLARGGSPGEQWSDPALLLSQSCGYPVTHAYARVLRVVATPCHQIDGCEQGRYASVVVVGNEADVTELAQLRGWTAVVNERTSHSGTNALGALLAPLTAEDAQDEPFFEEVRVSGSHEASLAAVAAGEATVAAIDCVTHALLARWRPRALVGTRVLCTTPSAPALPYVTRASASEALVERLRAGLQAAMGDEALRDVREALLLSGVTVLPDGAYDEIARLQATHRLQLRAGPSSSR